MTKQYRLSELANSPVTSELIRDAMRVEEDLVQKKQLTAEEKVVSVPAPLPGDLASRARGLAGLPCVIIAGWTTANPTIYRAGLAFQAIIPRTSRFLVRRSRGD
ncbi:MAG: hypothetical protein ACQESR_13635 [Planctomycetota bacterium]